MQYKLIKVRGHFFVDRVSHTGVIDRAISRLPHNEMNEAIKFGYYNTKFEKGNRITWLEGITDQIFFAK